MNAIAAFIGLKRCNELLFLHSLSGCDYTSSFFHVGKVKFWDAWLKNSVVSETFLQYSNHPTLALAEENLKVIESFVVSLYVTESDIRSSVYAARYQIFKYHGKSNLKSDCYHLHGMLWSNIFKRPYMCLVISGEHHAYRQERRSHQQIGHGLSLTIE